MTFAPETTVQIRAKRYVLTNLSDEILADTPEMTLKGRADIGQNHRNLAVLPPTSSSFHSEKHSIRYVSLNSIRKGCIYMANRNVLKDNRNKGESSDKLVTFVGQDSECS